MVNWDNSYNYRMFNLINTNMKTFHELMSHSGGLDSYANFMGDDEDYKNWYVFLSHSRDSGILTESNFDCALESLGGEGENIQVIRHGHWACGWVEFIAVKPDTKESIIAEEIKSALADYPVLNDEDYFQREWDAKHEYWESMDLKDRIELCVKANQSIFAARSESIPEDVDMYIEID